MGVALLGKVLLVLVPAIDALLVELVWWVDRHVARVHVVVQAHHLHLAARHTAIDHRARHLRIPSIVLVSRFMFGCLVSREHLQDAEVLQSLVLHGEVYEVLAADAAGVAADARGQGREVRRVHAHGVSEDVPPEVARRPDADHLLDLVEAVRLPVGDEAEALDDVGHALELRTLFEVQAVVRAALQQVLMIHAAPRCHGEESDVTNAEAASALDGTVPVALLAED
mmetsp:Transcript_85110/g.219253  ORF Transcript_85110/g.219253 Transcript_85110/m.219253 type:complete len:226 (+) Transcript_85110:353-1030(+)